VGQIPFLRGTALPTAKAAREAENTAALGGLRNPNFAVAKSPGLQAVGARIRRIAEDFGRKAYNKDIVRKVYGSLGTKDAHCLPAAVIEEFRAMLQEEFHVAADITRLAKRANKPDKDTPTPLINKGRFSVGFGLRNLMRMDQQPILNCPGRRPGQFETGLWFIPMRFRSQNQSQTGPFSSKGLGCLPGRLNAERYERHCLYMPLIPNGSTWDVLGYKIEGP
jgi:hypothetical protein